MAGTWRGSLDPWCAVGVRPSVVSMTQTSHALGAEGWYRDPFGVHEDRWFSAGAPTRLVRDAGVESSDEPPGELGDAELVEVPHPQASDGSDLLRADAAEQPRTPQEQAALLLAAESAAAAAMSVD